MVTTFRPVGPSCTMCSHYQSMKNHTLWANHPVKEHIAPCNDTDACLARVVECSGVCIDVGGSGGRKWLVNWERDFESVLQEKESVGPSVGRTNCLADEWEKKGFQMMNQREEKQKGGRRGGGGGRTHATPCHSLHGSDAIFWKMWPLIPRNHTQHQFVS